MRALPLMLSKGTPMDKLEVKAALSVDDTGTITGIAWPFGSPDRVGDVIEKGAFASAARLPMLFAHDQAQAIGVWESITETTEGLIVKGRLLVDDVVRAKEVRALVREGAVTGLSIGFVTKKSAPRRAGGRTISKLDLHEISIVPVPSHSGARVSSVKAADAAQEVLMSDVEGADIAALEKKFDDRLKAVETKGLDPKVVDRLDKIEAKLNRPETSEKKDEISDERKAFSAYLAHGNNAGPDTLKTLVVSSDPQGGYLAPAEMSGEFIRDLVQFSPIRGLASVRSTSTGSVTYPRRTGITNAKWKGETQTQEESEPTFGQVEIPVREINTYVDISNQLLADSAGVAEAEVRMALADDFGQKEALSFVKGNGPLAPEGLMVAAGVGYKATGNASTLGSDPAGLLIDFIYSLPAAYRNRGTWLMNGTTIAAIRKLKDPTTGTYLWQPALVAGQPETLLGRPLVEAVDMDDVGSGKEPIVFGDITTAYRIVDRLALSILVNPYIRATDGITRIHATRRVGAAVVQPAAIRKIRCATS
jgi:HK97 family phage major capsid protein/HK97 family phage prohead protease